MFRLPKEGDAVVRVDTEKEEPVEEGSRLDHSAGLLPAETSVDTVVVGKGARVVGRVVERPRRQRAPPKKAQRKPRQRVRRKPPPRRRPTRRPPPKRRRSRYLPYFLSFSSLFNLCYV